MTFSELENPLRAAVTLSGGYLAGGLQKLELGFCQGSRRQVGPWTEREGQQRLWELLVNHLSQGINERNQHVVLQAHSAHIAESS